MNQEEIIFLALDNLQKNTQIQSNWDPASVHAELNGFLTLNIENQKIRYNVEIKNELRYIHLQQVIAHNRANQPYMLLAHSIFPKIKDQLRLNKIAYLEANGNIYLTPNGITIWIDTNTAIEKSKNKSSRAFTKTGLKVVFKFLIDDTWVNKPYRQIAEQTGTGIGNITNIINGLKQDGFLIPLNRNEHILNNKKDLLDKWVNAYEQKLKPNIKIGTFRFLDDVNFYNWKNLPLNKGKSYWGAEPAADLLTNYLRPAELTCYTTETRNELIKNYRLIPDETGNIKIYNKFWHDSEMDKNTVPPLLIYADLINMNDRRCTEVAQKIYDEYLQNKL